MNKRKIITSALVVALTLAACQRNDDPGDGLRRQVDISTTIDGHAQGVRTRAAMNPDGSGTFENGDKILLTHSINGNAPTMLDYTLGSSKLYWEDVVTDTYNAIHFGGWYPACHPEGNLSDPQPYDVAGAADDTHRDLLIAAQTSANYGAPVTLAFRHVMHKLTVNLKSGEHSAEQLAKAEVKLMGFKSHAGVHFPSGKVDAEEASGTDEYPTKKGASVSFIVAPQNLISGKPMLVIAIGNEAFVYEVPAKFTGCDDDAPCCLMSGKRLTLTLSLSLGSGQGGNTATLIEGGISAWDEQGSLDGTATEEGGGASADVQFPDPNFKAYVLEKFDTDKDGKISTAEAEAVTKINVSGKGIADLTGIELFTKLEKLVCEANQLTKLDVSKCSLLKELDCTGNVLTSLNISGCTRLESLECSYNNLAALNISNCTFLKSLQCYDNKLEKLDIGATEVLEFLACGGQQENKKLTLTLGNDHNREKWKTEWKLFAHNMNVLPTDLPGGGASAEQFPDPNFKAYVLEKFDKDKDGKISTAEAEAVTEIKVPIKEIADLTGIGLFTNLKKLICYDNELTKLDVSGCTLLKELYCYYNKLEKLDVSKCTQLEKLVCYSNQLTELDVSKCTQLEKLVCYSNQLTKLDVSKCTQLEKLLCQGNRLTELNISGCTHLKKLQCYNNKLEKLDVSKNTGLETLSCYNNKLTKLEVSANTALKLLYCYDNALTSLEVSKNTSLETLSCHNNEIATLNVSGCTPLKALFCYNNKLTTLNVGATKVLEKLMCGIQKEDRQLTLTLGNARNRDKWKTVWRFSPENQRVTVADEN